MVATTVMPCAARLFTTDMTWREEREGGGRRAVCLKRSAVAGGCRRMQQCVGTGGRTCHTGTHDRAGPTSLAVYESRPLVGSSETETKAGGRGFEGGGRVGARRAPLRRRPAPAPPQPHLCSPISLQAPTPLTQEEDARVGDQRNANVHPLGLAATDAARHSAAGRAGRGRRRRCLGLQRPGSQRRRPGRPPRTPHCSACATA